MSPDEIAELRRLAWAARPGPWQRDHGIIWGASGFEKVVYSGALTHDVDTLEFIAASREAIPKLLDEIEVLRDNAKALRLEGARRALDMIPGYWPWGDASERVLNKMREQYDASDEHKA